MSREIKFRAWNKVRNVMVDVLRVDFNIVPWAINGDHMAINYELMQYVGKDKNNNDVFEGDIVEKFPNCFYKVSYEDFGWFTDDGDCLDKPTLEQIVVIGNIYENPELLTNQ